MAVRVTIVAVRGWECRWCLQSRCSRVAEGVGFGTYGRLGVPSRRLRVKVSVSVRVRFGVRATVRARVRRGLRHMAISGCLLATSLLLSGSYSAAQFHCDLNGQVPYGGVSNVSPQVPYGGGE